MKLSRYTIATLVAVAAAFAAPVAQAQSDLVDRWVDRQAQRHPDDRVGIRGPGATPVAPATIRIGHPDDRAGLKPVPNSPVLNDVSTPVVGATDEFRWSDFGIGVASGLAAMLFAAAALLLVRQQRSRLGTA